MNRDEQSRADGQDEDKNTPNVRRLMDNLARAIERNALQRSKYLKEPMRFAESEADLDTCIRDLEVIGTSPSVYGEAIQRGLCQNLLATLDHDNIDIVGSTCTVVTTLLEPDVNDNDCASAALVESLVETGVFVLMSEVYGKRLSCEVFEDREQEENDERVVALATASSILTAFENATELRSDQVDVLAEKCNLVPLCLTEIKGASKVDRNEITGQAVEVLAILLHNNEKNKERFTSQDGIAIVLEEIRRSVRPGSLVTAAETENVANMLSLISSAVLGSAESTTGLHKAGGIELLLSLLKARKEIRESATKLLDYACSSSKATIRRLVDIGGIVPVCKMIENIQTIAERDQGSSTSSREDMEKSRAEAEHVLSIIYSICRYGTISDRKTCATQLQSCSGKWLKRLLLVYLDSIDEIEFHDSKITHIDEEREELLALIQDTIQQEKLIAHLCAVAIGEALLASDNTKTAIAIDGALHDIGGLDKVRNDILEFDQSLPKNDDSNSSDGIERLQDVLNNITKLMSAVR